ncbi:hypothetical protein EDB84DRAFT_1447257, partial [Lactarius hengduanensis]
MSNATNSGERMSTRGDAKEKMSKVMAIVRSGGLEEDSRQENSKAAKKSGKASTGKASTGKASTSKASKRVPVSKLVELEDASLRKAEAARSSHPRRLTDEVLSVGVDVVEVPCSESEINDAVTKVNAGTTDAARPIHKVAQNELGSSSDDDTDTTNESDRPPPKASGRRRQEKEKESKQSKVRDSGCEEKINTTVVTWVHGISPPNSPPPKKQKSVSAKPSIVISKVSTKAKTTSGKSASCAIVSTSTTNVLAKPNSNLQVTPSPMARLKGGAWRDGRRLRRRDGAGCCRFEPHEGISCRTKEQASTYALGSQVPLNKKPKKRGNGELPNGALTLEGGRPSSVPTFSPVPWSAWKRTSGPLNGGHRARVTSDLEHSLHRKPSPASPEVAKRSCSTGLSVVGDFMDSTGLDTTEARREAAEQLLSNER